MKWYLAVLKKYVAFSGRAGKREFWYFVLFNFLILSAIASVVGGGISAVTGIGTYWTAKWVTEIYCYAVLLPALGVSVRRLHDTGKSGWWVLIALTLVGAFLLLYFYIQDSDVGDNKYGPDPRSVAQLSA
jgi:uncharacterized membrane protein YhaH (DUF805 family)